MQKALSAGTLAVNKTLSDLFKGDKELQQFVATLPAAKPKAGKTKTPTQLKGAA